MKDDSLYIPVHAGLWEHPKLLRLSRRLGISDVEAVGHLVSLWTWVVRYAPDGDVSDFNDEEIEDAARWRGEHGDFAALLRALELVVDGRINDWQSYAGEGLAMRAGARERQAAKRAGMSVEEWRKRDGHVTVTPPSRDVTGDRDRTEPYRTEPEGGGAPAPAPGEEPPNRGRTNPNAPPPAPGRVLTDEELHAIRRKNGVGAGRGFMENPADFPQTPEALLERHRAELERELFWLDGRAGRTKLGDAVAGIWPSYLKRRDAVGGGHENAFKAAKVWLRQNTGEDRRAYEREHRTTATTDGREAVEKTATRILKPIEGPHPSDDPEVAAAAKAALEAMRGIGKPKPVHGKPARKP